MPAQKNSLVANINRRKRAGKSRPKARSTVSTEAYARMEAGWPSGSKKKVVAKKKGVTKKKASAKKKAVSKKKAVAKSR